MLISFDPGDIDKALTAWLRTNIEYEKARAATLEEHDVWVDMAFADLAQSGLIEPIRPFSTAGQKLYEKLLKTYRVSA
jgi:hypothetical protein